MREIPRHVWQIKRQSCPHHNGVRATVTRLANVSRVRTHSLHDVYRNGTTALRKGQRTFNLAIKCHEIGAIEGNFIPAAICCGEQIRVMMTKIDTGDGANSAELCNGASQTVRRYADAHTPLYHGQQRASFE